MSICHETIKHLIIAIILFSTHLAIAIENPIELNEKTIKNFTYHLTYSGKTVKLEDGEYKHSSKKSYFRVKVEKYDIYILQGEKPITTEKMPIAVVILSEDFGGSAQFSELAVLFKEKDKISQTNSIAIGNRIEVKILEFHPSFDNHLLGKEKDSIILTTISQTKEERQYFNLISDQFRKLKLLSCSDLDLLEFLRDNAPPPVKKPAIYLYPEKTEQIEVTLNPKVPDYEITFIREKEDFCKAFLPRGVIIEYDLAKDFNIKMPYTLKTNNPVIPFIKGEPYFIIGQVKNEPLTEAYQGKFVLEAMQEMIADIKQDVKKATIYAII